MPACMCTPLFLYEGIHPFLPLDHLDLFSSNIAVDKQRKVFFFFAVQELSKNCFTHWLCIYWQHMRYNVWIRSVMSSAAECVLIFSRNHVLFSFCSVIPFRSSMRRVAQVMKKADGKKHDKFSNQFNYALNWPAASLTWTPLWTEPQVSSHIQSALPLVCASYKCGTNHYNVCFLNMKEIKFIYIFL